MDKNRQALIQAGDTTFAQLLSTLKDRTAVHTMAGGGAITEDPRAVTGRISAAYGNINKTLNGTKSNDIVALDNEMATAKANSDWAIGVILKQNNIMSSEEQAAWTAGGYSLLDNPKVQAALGFQQTLQAYAQTKQYFDLAQQQYQKAVAETDLELPPL